MTEDPFATYRSDPDSTKDVEDEPAPEESAPAKADQFAVFSPSPVPTRPAPDLFGKFTAAAKDQSVGSPIPSRGASDPVAQPGRATPSPAETPAAPSTVAPASPPSGAGSFDLDLFQDDDDASPVDPSGTDDNASSDQPPYRLLPTVLSETPELAPGAALVLGEGGIPPVVGLSRAQSGIGSMSVRMEAPGGGLVLGLLAEDTDGVQAVIGPASEPFPIAALHPSGHVLINLRRVRELRRVLIFVTAKSPRSVWQGLITATLPSGTKAHTSLTFPEPGENAAAFSILVVDGHLVLRAERDHRDIPLRVLARAYGYSRIAWVNDRTPVGVN